MQTLQDQIKRLSKGKSTKSKIGSRAIGHRLTNIEQKKLDLALQRGYLVFHKNDRANIRNIFELNQTQKGFDPIVVESDSEFNLSKQQILEKINQIDLQKYAESRNFLEGAVTRLSPYITRGVITIKEIYDILKLKYPNLDNNEKLVKELAWREYFLRVREHIKDNIFSSVRSKQEYVSEHLPAAIYNAQTGINVIDKQISLLVNTGYIHNHARMWIASIVSNVAKTQWQTGAKWMYYYLLDGELSSNYLSWQWISGTFSSKKYYANQENINYFSNSTQNNTFLDKDYEDLQNGIEIPPILEERIQVDYPNNVLALSSEEYSTTVPTLLYSAWSLDPDWHKEDKGVQRILLLEPSHFAKFPVSGRVLAFIISQALKIKGLKIVVKDYKNLKIPKSLISTKAHLNTSHWRSAIFDPMQYLFPEKNGYFRSFSNYWESK